ncbi:MAG: general secretion pathway protein GspK [Bdellovibrionaceae bacterium]|nr:general secretion pathway protein GspK [Pseudobdellovibrionaceae bacterium]
MKTLNTVSNQRGSAILYATFLMTILLFIALEIAKDSIVEYQSSANSVKRVQAYYAAKSCLQISLLRVKAYQQARSLATSLPDPTILDMLWQFPMSWPLAIPGGLSTGDADNIKKLTHASTFKHQFSSKITSESGKIDINDLASPSEGLRNKTRQQLLDLFAIRVREDTPFAKKYSNFRFDLLLNDITDWIDADRTQVNNGDSESNAYDAHSDYIPPNQPFKTIEELHMVKGMTDEIFEVLAPAITLYGGKGINVNYADESLLRGLDPQITEEVAKQVIRRRSDPSLGGPFKNEQDFFGFIGGFGVNTSNFNEQKVPLYFDQEINFHISCIGIVGNITREINAVVYDFQKVQSRLQGSIKEDDPQFNKQCKDKTGDELYDCLCSDKQSDADKKKCVDDKKKQNTGQPDQSGNSTLPSGPPYVIFQDVK